MVLMELSSTAVCDYRSGLLRITKAAITPGTHPHKVNKNTIKIDPHPLPITDRGGNNIASKTLQKLIGWPFI